MARTTRRRRQRAHRLQGVGKRARLGGNTWLASFATRIGRTLTTGGPLSDRKCTIAVCAPEHAIQGVTLGQAPRSRRKRYSVLTKDKGTQMAEENTKPV